MGIQATLARHDEKFKMVASSLGENLEKKDGKLIFEDIKIWISIYQETIDELSYLVPLISAMTEDIHQSENKDELSPDTEIIEDLLDLEEDSLAIDSRSE